MAKQTIEATGNLTLVMDERGLEATATFTKGAGKKWTQKEVIVVMGGPMMGTSTVSDDVVVSKTTTSVLVFKNVEYKEEPCVRCGSCVYSCPTHLQPTQIMQAVKRNDKEVMKGLDALKCIECGLCTYVCTSRIHVTEYIRKAKIAIG